MPESITVDNGSEFCSRALEAWTMANEVQLCFIRPGRPVENGFIESFRIPTTLLRIRVTANARDLLRNTIAAFVWENRAESAGLRVMTLTGVRAHNVPPSYAPHR